MSGPGQRICVVRIQHAHRAALSAVGPKCSCTHGNRWHAEQIMKRMSVVIASVLGVVGCKHPDPKDAHSECTPVPNEPGPPCTGIETGTGDTGGEYTGSGDTG